MTIVPQTPDKYIAAKDRKAVLWTIFGSVLGLVLLYAATRKVDGPTLFATLKSANLSWGFGFVIIVGGFTWLKALRWQLLLRPILNVRLGEVHSAVYIGLAVNFLIAHVGEFLRTAVIARANEVSLSAVFATVVVERALDFVAFLVVIVVLSMFASGLPEYVGTAVQITGVLVLLAVTGLYLFLHAPDWLVRFCVAVSRPIPETVSAWIYKQIELFQQGLNGVRDVRMMLTVLLISVLQWALIVAAIWCSAIMVGEEVSVVSLVATFVLILVGLMLPNSPMQIGTAQLAFTIGLGTGGVMATAAVAASLVYTFLLVVPVMIIGGICLIKSRRQPTEKLS